MAEVFGCIIFHGNWAKRAWIVESNDEIMKSPHLLNLGNARKVRENLSGILDTTALALIEREIDANVVAFLTLGRRYYLFATDQSSQNWRHKVSRLYYAAYSVARGVRLYVTGEYSTDVRDHHRFDKLPDDFPTRDRYVNQLSILREDRNLCDYDHIATARDLVLGSSNSAALVRDFMDDARSYLRGKGLSL